MVCSIQRTIPQDASAALLRQVAGYLADALGRNRDFLMVQLQDATLCDEITASLRPQPQAAAAPDILVTVNEHGYPVSSNSTWNACFEAAYGSRVLTRMDIVNNPDAKWEYAFTKTRKDKATPPGCAHYNANSSQVWYFPDTSVYFTFDSKTNVAQFPVGYALQQQTSVAGK